MCLSMSSDSGRHARILSMSQSELAWWEVLSTKMPMPALEGVIRPPLEVLMRRACIGTSV